ncbi:cell differentiation protein rcd1 [Batrachochytrium dendrobatidis JEL423]|uniref:Cell differentiation protein rcd1 n=1 Tax=Batrachochytrium dendrobatidis (strain JEL423) TaxID=403673 RepID=A0A177WI23_BATDL|nr:cell differentiation protein rcd1 [Batrachochytrium dendrobatidis JEL423]
MVADNFPFYFITPFSTPLSPTVKVESTRIDLIGKNLKQMATVGSGATGDTIATSTSLETNHSLSQNTSSGLGNNLVDLLSSHISNGGSNGVGALSNSLSMTSIGSGGTLSHAVLSTHLGSAPGGMNALTGGNGSSITQALNDEEKIYQLILDLTSPNTREQAMLELSKKRETYEHLAPFLWHSFGVVTALLQEIISVYPMLTPPTLTGVASNRVCNALALLQCIASHNETRPLFLGAHIPLFLYPFLNTTNKTRPFEYLRLTSLGVIGALVKNDNSEVINFLLSTEIIPLCLRIMETGSELSKTVAIFIVQKILLDEMGLNYICETYERFYAVGTVLSNMVSQLIDQQSIRLLKHVIRCYLRLSDNVRAREALRQCLPDPLRDSTFAQILKDDITTKRS